MIQVRSLSADDNDGILSAALLMLSMLVEEGMRLSCDTDPLNRLEDELRSDIANRQAFVYLATYRDALVGVIECKITSDFSTGPRLECFRLYVVPSHRNKGIAYKLIQAATTAIPEGEDCLVLITTKGDLPRSYAKLSFQPVMTTHAARMSDIRKSLRGR